MYIYRYIGRYSYNMFILFVCLSVSLFLGLSFVGFLLVRLFVGLFSEQG